MKVMVMVKATALSETGAPPSVATLAAMERFNGELVKAGVLLAAEGLQAEPQRQARALQGCGATPWWTARSQRPRSWSPVSGCGR